MAILNTVPVIYRARVANIDKTKVKMEIFSSIVSNIINILVVLKTNKETTLGLQRQDTK